MVSDNAGTQKKLRDEYLATELPKFKWFAEKIRAANFANPTILDVGFGQAPNPYLAGNVVGLELADVPKPDNYARVITWNLDHLPLPFEDESVDVAILGDVIEHLNRPFELLRDMKRILSRQGILLISTPNPHYVHEVLKTWLGVYFPDDPEHFVHFPKNNLQQFLETLGFSVDEVRFYKFWVPKIKKFWLKVGIPSALGYQYLLLARRTPSNS